LDLIMTGKKASSRRQFRDNTEESRGENTTNGYHGSSKRCKPSSFARDTAETLDPQGAVAEETTAVWKAPLLERNVSV
jgi:hypothetical protein